MNKRFLCAALEATKTIRPGNRGRGRGSPASVPIFVAALACTLFWPGGALWGQAAGPPEADRPVEIPAIHDDITVNARLISAAGSSVTVITRRQIEDSGVRTAAEVLQAVPGLYLQSSGTRGGLSAVYMRGGDPNLSLVLLDGVPVNDATDQLGGIYNLEGLSADAIESVEVVRGPLSTLFGPQALAGVINIRTRGAPSSGTILTADAETGNAGLARAAAFAAGSQGDNGYALGFGFEREEGRVAQDAFRDAHVQGSLELALNPKTTLGVRSRAAFWQADDYPDASGGPRFGSGETRHSENDAVDLAADLAYQPSESWRHGFTLTYFRHHLDRLSPGVGFEVPPATEGTLWNRIRGTWTSQLPLAEGVLLRLGADFDRESADNRLVLTLPAIFGGPIDGSYRADRTGWGAFGEIALSKGRFEQSLGLRVDWPDNFEPVFSPRASASYWLAESRTRLRGSIGRAFKLPSFFALFSPPQLGGNPALLEETSWGGDIGLDQRIASADLTLGASLFYNRFRNLIDFDFDRFLHVNRTRLTTKGIEVFATWSPSEQFSLNGSYTFLDSREADSAAPVLHRPRHTGGISADWKPHPRLAFCLRGRFTSDSFDRQIPVPGRDRVEGYFLTSLSSSYRCSRRLEVRTAFDNLLDTDYEDLIGFPGAGFGFRVSLRLSVAP